MDYKRNHKKSSNTYHLQDQANFLSRFLFWWELHVVYRKWRNKISEDDFSTPVKNQKSRKLGDRLEQFWEGEKHFSKTPSLMKTLFKTLGSKYILTGSIFFLGDLMTNLLQPYCFSKLFDSFSSRQNQTGGEIFYYGSIVVALSFFRVLTINFFLYEMSATGTKARVACTSLLYRKVLKLKKATVQKIGVGRILNLLTKDVEQYDLAFIYLNFFWMVPLKILITLLYNIIFYDLSFSVGFLAIIAFTGIQVCALRKITATKKASSTQTDQRISLMSATIYQIQEIKMNAWEKLFETMVKQIRKSEVDKISKTIYYSLINCSIVVCLPNICIFLCILTAVLCNLSLKSYYVFVISNFYDTLSSSIVMFGYVIAFFPKFRISVQSMQELLLTDHEILETESNCVLKEKIKSEIEVCGVFVDNVSVKWESSSHDALKSVTFVANSSDLVAIVGVAGGGKSTLLQTILKEVDVVEGSVLVGGTVSYSPQEPWIFPATVRQNILFGEEMDRDKYESVIRICALEHDLSQLSHGDNTLVGERGVKLSGGQKARISLARAVYRNADVYLLDDPLSAVDGHVANHIFNECILKYLKEKCVVLVTHQVQYLDCVDKIYVLDKGSVVASGRYQDLKDLLGKTVESGKRQLETSSIKLLDCEVPAEAEEYSGSTVARPYTSYLIKEGRWITASCYLFLLLGVHVLITANSYFLSCWANWKNGSPFEYSDEDLHGLYIYTALTALVIILIFSSILVFKKHCSVSSLSLHDALLDKTLTGSMNFFNDHFSGRILSRFSRDISVIDEVIPQPLFDFTRITLTVTLASVMIAILNYWMVIPTMLAYAIFYINRLLFVPVIDYLKRIEKKRTSPVCTHISASLQGLDMIRALAAQNLIQKEFENHQNRHSSVYAMHKVLQFAYAFWTDLVCVLYSAIVIICFLFFHNVSPVGAIGLAATQSIMLIGRAQFGMKLWNYLDTYMTSVERVVEYTELATEKDDGSYIPPKSWPQNGRIVFHSVSMRYSPEKPIVLKNVSFTIESGEKIGIVGRTGAGKSSLVSVLFRLFDYEGTVFVDDVDTKTIPLNILRSKITIISQEPVLFPGTLRKNLDPFDEIADSELWRALEEVELKDFVTGLPSGLNAEIAEGGSNFSVGQRQLFCLVRVILMNSKIIVLDEPTACIDLKTDRFMQSVLRRRFENSTVLTIAHRLDTVIDSDRFWLWTLGLLLNLELPRNCWIIQKVTFIRTTCAIIVTKPLAKKCKNLVASCLN